MSTVTISLDSTTTDSNVIAITAGSIMISSSLDSNFNSGVVQLLQEKQTAGQYIPILSFTKGFSQLFSLNSANYKLRFIPKVAGDPVPSLVFNIVT